MTKGKLVTVLKRKPEFTTREQIVEYFKKQVPIVHFDAFVNRILEGNQFCDGRKLYEFPSSAKKEFIERWTASYPISNSDFQQPTSIFIFHDVESDKYDYYNVWNFKSIEQKREFVGSDCDDMSGCFFRFRKPELGFFND